MRRMVLIVAALALIAASAGEVIAELENTGFYIEAGSSAASDVVGDAVAEAGFAGSRLYVVVLASEPPSGATFFSDQVLDELGDGTVVTVAPETIGWASEGDIWSEDQLDAAAESSLDGPTDEDAVTRFVESLTGAGSPTGSESPPADQSSGGSGLIWLLVIGAGLVGLFFFLGRRSQSVVANARRSRLEEFRMAAQAKLDDIANDILDMEEEVAMSESPEIRRHYDRASATYADLIDEIPTAAVDDDLADLIHRLDVAIWELDAAEALLDDKAIPPKPEKPTVAQPAAEPASAEVAGPSPDEFDRRPQRRSSPTGPDLNSILLAILAAQGMGGPRRGDTWGHDPRPRGPGGGFGGGMGGSGGGRMRGGGRRRG